MFDKVVFAGGGNRCWWQAGFWDAVGARIELRPRVIAAVSAGAATACLVHANDSIRALAWYQRELAGLRSNVRWANLVRRGEPLLPHAAICRKALRALLGGERFRQLLWSAPEIRVQISRLAPGCGPLRAAASGWLAHALDRYVDRGLHSARGRRLGFTHEVLRVQDCRSERELVDLLVAASGMPPFMPMETIAGLPCLDGGLVDTAPIDVVADVPGSTLVLLTRHRRNLSPVFVREGRIYVQPSRPIGVGRWDCTSPARLRAAYDLGAADAVAFVALFVHDRMPTASPPPSLPPVPGGGRSDGRSDGRGEGAIDGRVNQPRETPVLLAP